MPTKPINRLLFAQGGLCFFCQRPLAAADATVEHFLAKANGGANSDENCVACCKTLNTLFGRMSLKEKLKVVLNQNGRFTCPNGIQAKQLATKATGGNRESVDRLDLVVEDLRKRGSARPATTRSLTSTVAALFKKQLPASEVDDLVSRLQLDGIISVSGTKVTYDLPE